MTGAEIIAGIVVTVVGGVFLVAVIGGWNRLLGWVKQRRAASAAERERVRIEGEQAAEQARLEKERAAKRQRRDAALKQLGEGLGKFALGMRAIQAVRDNPDLVVPGKVTVVLANGSNPRTVLYSNGTAKLFFTDHQRYVAWCQQNPSDAPRSFKGSGPKLGQVVGDINP